MSEQHRNLGRLAVMLCVSGTAAAAPVYVQGSSLNLREAPNATAKVVKVIPIATPCEVVSEPGGGWAQVKCGPGLDGYLKLEFLGPSKPELAPLLEQAKSASLDAKQRLNFALRAAALAPDNADARALVKQLFFDTEFDSLKEVRAQREVVREKRSKSKAGKARLAHEVQARPFHVAPCTKKEIAECIIGPPGAMDFETAVVRGNDAVHIIGSKDSAHWEIESGALSWNDAHDQVTFTVEKEYHQPPNAPLYTSLSGKPFDPDREKRLSEQAQWRLLDGLPSSWYGAEADGNYVSVDCNGTLGYSIDLRQEGGQVVGASWITGGVRDSNIDTIDRVEHPSKNEYVLHIGAARLTLEYPPSDGPLAGRKNAAYLTYSRSDNTTLLIDRNNSGRAKIARHCFEEEGG